VRFLISGTSSANSVLKTPIRGPVGLPLGLYRRPPHKLGSIFVEAVLTWISPVLIVCIMLAAFAEYELAQRGVLESQYAVAGFWAALERFEVRDVFRYIATVADGTLSLWFGSEFLSVKTLLRWIVFSAIVSMIVSTTFLLTYEGGLLEPLTREHHVKVGLSALLAIVTVDFACMTLHRWMFRKSTTASNYFFLIIVGALATYIAISFCNVIFYFQWLSPSWETFRGYFLWPVAMAANESQIVLFTPAFLAALLFTTCCVIVLFLALTRFVSKPLIMKIVAGLAAGPKGLLTIAALALTIVAALVATLRASFMTN
jgi:hypothetical protein